MEIKGSEQTLRSDDPFLPFMTYLQLSTRAHSTLASKRKEIYTLFEAYQKERKQRRDYDAADRTHLVLGEIRKKGIKGKKLDFL